MKFARLFGPNLKARINTHGIKLQLSVKENLARKLTCFRLTTLGRQQLTIIGKHNGQNPFKNPILS